MRRICEARMKAVLTMIVLCGWATTCWATNISFLQGDAFFPTSFREKDLLKFIQSKSPKAYYSITSHTAGFGGAGCGSAGHTELQFARFPEQYREGLVMAFQEFQLQKLSKGEIFVLAYGSDFDITKNRIGLQYNEDWVSESLNFGASRQMSHIQVLVDPRWIVESWRDADDVPGLSVKLIDSPEKKFGPVELQGKFKLVVLPDNKYEDYCSRKEGCHIIVIEEKVITEYVAKRGEWVAAQSQEFKNTP